MKFHSTDWPCYCETCYAERQRLQKIRDWNPKNMEDFYFREMTEELFLLGELDHEMTTKH